MSIPSEPHFVRSLPRFLAAAVSLGVAAVGTTAWAQAATASSLMGDLEVIAAVASPQLDNERDLLVLLPPGYRQGTERYPVMYLNDGQNVFDEATSYAGEWRADEAAQASAARGHPVILVAIPNMGEERLAEYAPFPAPESDRVARAEAYAAFLANTVKPLIDERYRTLPTPADTAIVGSSMGGLVSLYTAFRYPGVFGFAGALSPSLWWGAGKPAFAWAELRANPGVRVWLDMGTEEGWSQTQDVVRMAALLRDAGLDVRLTIDRGATHHETAWSARFPDVLAWFLRETTEERSGGAVARAAVPAPTDWDEAGAAGLATLAGARLAHGAPRGGVPSLLRFDASITEFGYDEGLEALPVPGTGFDMLVDLDGRRVRLQLEHDGQVAVVQQVGPGERWLWAADGTFLTMDADASLAIGRYAVNTVIGLFGRHDGFVAAVGPTTAAGLDGDGVTVVEGGAMTTFVFAADRTLIAERMEQPWTDAVELAYRDVRTVDGLRIPHRIEQFQNGVLTAVIELSNVVVDPALAEGAFDRP